MTKSKAISIVKDICNDTDPEDKLTALQEVCGMETINSVTKQDLLEALRWLVEDYI